MIRLLSKWTVAFVFLVGLLVALQVPNKVSASTSGVSIHITVINSNEAPVGRVRVGLTGATAPSSIPFPLSVQTDDEGRASFDNLPAGSYKIQVLTSRDLNQSLITSFLNEGDTYSGNITFDWKFEDFPKLSFSFQDTLSNDVNKIAGIITWSIYKNFEYFNGTKVLYGFFDNEEKLVGELQDSGSTLVSDNGTFNLPPTPIPTGATRIGIQLQDGDFTVAKQTMPIWKTAMYAPVGLKFTDLNPHGGVVDGLLTWSGSADDSQVAGYRVFYREQGDEITDHLLGVIAKRADKTYQFRVTDIPSNLAYFAIGANNAKGEELYSTLVLSDNQLADTVTNVTYSESIPVPTGFTGYTMANPQGIITGSFGWSVPTGNAVTSAIQGYHLYFADAQGRFLQPISKVYLPKGWSYLSYQFNDSTVLPTGAKQIANTTINLEGQESAPVYVPINMMDPHPELHSARSIQFTDWDEHQGKIHGSLSWQHAVDESMVKEYVAYFTDVNWHRLGEIGRAAKDGPLVISIPASTAVPQGAANISLYTVFTTDPSNISSTWSGIGLTDNTSQSQVQNALRNKYFPITSTMPTIDISRITTALTQSSNPFGNIDKEDVAKLLSLISPQFLH
ncbi:carboxypeptidase-like regulatory domain-containing protein [Paenibacillus sp. GCM10027628]|uniref:carboxypeptidase-like regulatory domain-containing protein n=1 Tax=Paenibacillus sp. GCM10027628 TaxID=3273413 RepID=UPI00362C49DB